MERLSAEPIHWSSLKAGEFDEPFSDDEAGMEEDETDPLAQMEAAYTLEGIFVKRRFDYWVSHRSGPGAPKGSRALLKEMYRRLEVLDRDASVSSSIRSLLLEFRLAGMEGRYEQRTHVDFESPVWQLNTQSSALELLPNVAAELQLDGEVLIRLEYFVGRPDLCKSSVDEERLSERFGSETLERLGGASVLLEFLGALCADSGAAFAAAALPFGLAQEAVALGEPGAPLAPGEARAPATAPPAAAAGTAATAGRSQALPPSASPGPRAAAATAPAPSPPPRPPAAPGGAHATTDVTPRTSLRASSREAGQAHAERPASRDRVGSKGSSNSSAAVPKLPPASAKSSSMARPRAGSRGPARG